ncbi:CAP domain-containing protein [Halegenticoccus tardaugens]|uniref:CAP domain-containing protein n=1 Tax=Halegenticoccus tardaugens TaxID=2071624 RepID=UPI00100A9276|nr:CAP domain-containing protein [Halegenticoccus tardaugens]
MAHESRRSFARKAAAVAIGGSTLGVVGTRRSTARATADEYEREVERAVHRRVNRIRTNRGLDPLAYGERLADVAAYHSEDMADEGYFSHTSPDGETVGDRYEKFGLACRRWGENILYNYAADESPTEAARLSVDQWMQSSGHRRNILADFWTAEGIGAEVASDGRLYLTQNFGTGCR